MAAATAAPPPNVAAAATVGGTSAAACLGWTIKLKKTGPYLSIIGEVCFLTTMNFLTYEVGA
jgi:hypothetical protein